jgi:hypothetical protein
LYSPFFSFPSKFQRFRICVPQKTKRHFGATKLDLSSTTKDKKMIHFDMTSHQYKKKISFTSLGETAALWKSCSSEHGRKLRFKGSEAPQRGI